MTAQDFEAKNVRTAKSRVTVRRKLASIRVSTQRRRTQGFEANARIWRLVQSVAELRRPGSGQAHFGRSGLVGDARLLTNLDDC